MRAAFPQDDILSIPVIPDGQIDGYEVRGRPGMQERTTASARSVADTGSNELNDIETGLMQWKWVMDTMDQSSRPRSPRWTTRVSDYVFFPLKRGATEEDAAAQGAERMLKH